MSGPLIYYAPGAGLGHLTRALAICLPLRDLGIDARIVSDSPFSAGIAALARCPVVDIDVRVEAGLVITDAFPHGPRDEWRNTNTPLLHIARRLKIPRSFGKFIATIEAEPLGIEGAITLDGPIRLAPDRIRTRVPRALDRDGLTLIVHSGPPEEVNALRALADEDAVVIGPFDGIDYYPAQNLYARARRVITGAGYNAMADMLWHRDKHSALAFERNYDDQHARLANFYTQPVDGTMQAVETITRVWRASESGLR
ncbi:MAG: hypothetical protein FJW32_25400 [Acidobacteria bacterium]|nr:hypothetical protein [Acidobacteriota bacterium]